MAAARVRRPALPIVTPPLPVVVTAASKVKAFPVS